jgi:hypothetical protein
MIAVLGLSGIVTKTSSPLSVSVNIKILSICTLKSSKFINKRKRISRLK